MKIQSILERVLAERVLEPVTADQYERAVKRFEESLGRQACLCDLTYENVNAWLTTLSKDLAAVTVCNYRRAILTIWNYAVSLGLIEPYARQRIRKPKIHPQIVRSWDLKQLEILLSAAQKIEGRMRCGTSARDFLTAWVWVGFDTGLRPIDLRLLRWKNVHADSGFVTIVQNKTKQPHTASLSQESINALECIRSMHAQKVFPLSKGGVRRWELKLFCLAIADGFDRHHGEGLGRLRSLHATEIYKTDGLSAAAESLGHIGGTRTVRAHYIDARAMHRGRLPRRPTNAPNTTRDASPG